MYCLGGFHFETEGRLKVNFGTQKARALLVYLAVEAPRSFRRSHLAGLLWSEYSEDKALHNLRQTLVRLRKGWPGDAACFPLLVTQHDTITLNPQVNLWVDLLAFESACEKAFEHFHDRNRMDKLDISSLMEAVNLYRGPFLDRFHLFDTLLFDEWSSLVRERTIKKALEAQTLLCEYYERLGDYAHASHLADKIAELAPWNNHACAHSMRLYAVQKQWTNAKRQYEGLNTYLTEHLGVPVNPSLTTLYGEIRELSNRDEALPPAIQVIENQVPVLASSFVGRQDEMRTLCYELANPQTRLISLLGRGGTGKTRLAIEIGHLLRGLYAQGVYFITLRDISSLEGLVWLMAERLTCSFSGTTPHQRQLLDFLRDKQCLLILDGCEQHLLYHAIRDLLSEILSNAPDVKVLATTRERLNLPEEHVFPLVGLNYQLDPSFSPDGENQHSEAAALFEQRARQVNHQFEFSADAFPLIEKLCLQVEGHPLSIELLASATATLSIPDLLDELNASQMAFDPAQPALSGEGRTLSIVLERSWQFLSATQQLTLSRLVSFQGGFTEAAALHIANTTPDILLSLVDKSFIHQINPDRFILHDIIHEFATQKAIKRGQLVQTRETHARYFVALLERIEDENAPIVTIDALDQIEADLDNLLSAWHYYIEQHALSKLEKCIDIFYQFFYIRSLFEEGMRLFEAAIHSADYLAPFDPLLGKLANRLGSLAQRFRANERAFQMYTRALGIFTPEGESVELGLAYIGLANHHMLTKEFDRALDYVQRALACFRTLGDRYHEGTALYLEGMIYQRSADFPRAKIKLAESLEISREVGDQRGMISRLNQLAGHDCNAGDYESAESRYLESLALSRAFKDRFQQAIILNNLASVYHPRGEYQKEQSVLEESLAICREIGDQDGEAIALNNLGELAIVQRAFQQALDYSRTALDIALRLGEDWTTIAVYDILGCAYLGLGDTTTACQCLEQALRMAYQIQSWDLLTRSLVNLAEVHLAQKEQEAAKDLLRAALSHPSILFEYGLKGVDLLSRMGEEPPDEKDAGVLLDALRRHFNLRPSGF
jgi:predicted ATPase/DNA-binding SARP family transcriptional activator